MNAQEMFEELGYELTDNKKNKKEFTKITNEDIIIFWNKEVEFYNIYDGYIVNNELYNAIHQQMKELGWLL